MAKLHTKRLDGSTDGSEYVVAHNELQQAISDILGVPVEQSVFESIFGSVASDGSFTRLKFVSESAESSPVKAPSIEFYDGVTTKRLCLVDSKLQVWRKVNSTTWVQEFDHEDGYEPTLISKSDVYILSYSDGKIIGTGEDTRTHKPAFVLVAQNVPSGGATEFDDLVEVSDGDWSSGALPGWTSHINKAVAVKDQNHLAPVVVADDEISWATGAVFLTSLPAQAWKYVQFSPIEGMSQIPGAPTAWKYPTIVSLNGTAKAGIRLSRGIYKLNVAISIHTSTTGYGWVKAQSAGPGFFTFPTAPGVLFGCEVPFWFQEPLYPGQADFKRSLSFDAGATNQPGWEIFTRYISVESSATWGMQFFHNNASTLDFRGYVSITRVN